MKYQVKHAVEAKINRLRETDSILCELSERLYALQEELSDSKIRLTATAEEIISNVVKEAKRFGKLNASDFRDTRESVNKIKKLLTQVEQNYRNLEVLPIYTEKIYTEKAKEDLHATVGYVNSLRQKLAIKFTAQRNQEQLKQIKQEQLKQINITKEQEIALKVIRYLNVGIKLALKGGERGALAAVGSAFGNIGTIASTLPFYLDLRESLRKELGKDWDKDVNNIMQSQVVRNVLCNHNIWHMLSLEGARLSQLISFSGKHIDMMIKRVIDEPSSLTSESKVALVKVLFSSGATALRRLLEDNGMTMEGFGYVPVSDAIVRYVKSSAEIAKRLGDLGIDPSHIQEGELLDKLLQVVSIALVHNQEILGAIEVVEKLIKGQRLGEQDIEKMFILGSAVLNERKLLNVFSAILTDQGMSNILSDLGNVPAIKKVLTNFGINFVDVEHILPIMLRTTVVLLEHGPASAPLLSTIQKLTSGVLLSPDDITQFVELATNLTQDERILSEIRGLLVNPSLLGIFNGLLSSDFIKEKFDDEFRSFVKDTVPVVLEILSTALDEKNLGVIENKVFSNIAILLSDTPYEEEKQQQVDKRKQQALFEVIDAGVELALQEPMRRLFITKISPLLEQNKPLLVHLLGRATSKIGVTIDANNMISAVTRPETLKRLKDAYEAFRDGKWLELAGSVILLLAIKEVRGVAAEALVGIIKDKIIEFIPNFMRRLYAGHEVVDALLKECEEVEVERIDLASVFASASQKIYSPNLISNHVLTNYCCKGLDLGKIILTNCDIEGFNLKGALLGTRENGTSLANSCIYNSDLSNVRLRGNIDLCGAKFDPKSFCSILPSLIKAQRSGYKVEAAGLALTSLDMTKEQMQQIASSPFAGIIDNTKALSEEKEGQCPKKHSLAQSVKEIAEQKLILGKFTKHVVGKKEVVATSTRVQ